MCKPRQDLYFCHLLILYYPLLTYLDSKWLRNMPILILMIRALGE